MDISPPTFSHQSSSGRPSAYSQIMKMRREAERAAYLATPEGQAQQRAAAEEQAAQIRAIKEVFAEYGYGNDDLDENGQHSKGKKNKKLHQKHPPKKSTGFLSGLMAKLHRKA